MLKFFLILFLSRKSITQLRREAIGTQKGAAPVGAAPFCWNMLIRFSRETRFVKGAFCPKAMFLGNKIDLPIAIYISITDIFKIQLTKAMGCVTFYLDNYLSEML